MPIVNRNHSIKIDSGENSSNDESPSSNKKNLNNKGIE
jgi:hypothetical protein